MAEAKTNAMRILSREKVAFSVHEYPHKEGVAVAGTDVARLIGKDPAQVYKTLVTKGASRANYVFVLPVEAELDLKKAAVAAGEKSIEMVRVADITPLTGYVRGGCSPVGMKKLFPTVFHSAVSALPTVVVSAGRIGLQIECAPADLLRAVNGKTADITV